MLLKIQGIQFIFLLQANNTGIDIHRLINKSNSELINTKVFKTQLFI